MRTKVSTFIVFFLTAGVILAQAADTALRSAWASRAYTVKPLPELWRPKRIPSGQPDVASFLKFDLMTGSLSIKDFVERYGLPDRYLVTHRRERQDFLIYDLPSGHAVALYVPKPPDKIFFAVVIIDRRGNFVRLTK
jgi:hypothetical protein